MKRFPLIPLCLALLALGLLGSCNGDSVTSPDGEGNGPSTTAPGNLESDSGTMIDSRDGQVYKTVKIGTQWWMAQNLNYKVDSSWCYLNSADSCRKYGRLYQWAAAMGLDASFNLKSWSGTLPRQGICPSGWHVPSDAEWAILTDYVGSSPGTKLKSSNGWASPGNGTDAFGFQVLPAGDRSADAKFRFVGGITYFWASTEFSSDSAWRRGVYSTLEAVLRLRNDKKTAHGIRCIEDSGSQVSSGAVVSPVFSLAGGEYTSALKVTLSSSTAGATIYYTIDGSAPTTSSTKYTEAISVSVTETVKAIVVRNDTSSAVSVVTFTIKSKTPTTGVTYGSFTDTRDGQVYKTVTIGTQTWMAQNLNFRVDSSWCYSNSTDSCAKYGRLYNWAGMLGLDARYNEISWREKMPQQGVCASGWHVSTPSEWGTLEKYVGGDLVAGKQLKFTGSGGTDAYGFSVLLPGSGSFWKSSDYLGGYGYEVSFSEHDAAMNSWEVKTTKRSLRCVQNTIQQLSDTASAPIFRPTAGAYFGNQSVMIASATSEETIYYTVNGSVPSTSSTKYTGPIVVGSTETIRAIAVRSGISSAASSATYTIFQVEGSATAIPWNSTITYGTLKDSRDSQVYMTVKLGAQNWMAQNLNYKVDSSWCPMNSPDSCSKYGRLYQWAAAMGLDPSYNSKPWSESSPRQGICPSGWHVPSDAEWTTLQTFVDPARTSDAIKLRSSKGWLSFTDSSFDGTDAHGFRALPGGQSYADIFYTGGIYGYWWTATGSGGTRAANRFINYYQAKVDVGSTTLKTTEYSVRCIQD